MTRVDSKLPAWPSLSRLWINASSRPAWRAVGTRLLLGCEKAGYVGAQFRERLFQQRGGGGLPFCELRLVRRKDGHGHPAFSVALGKVADLVQNGFPVRV